MFDLMPDEIAIESLESEIQFDKMYKDAVVRYCMMVNALKRIYGIVENVSVEQLENCDVTKSGHGYYVKKYV